MRQSERAAISHPHLISLRNQFDMVALTVLCYCFRSFLFLCLVHILLLFYTICDQWCSEGGAGRTGRHLLGAANGRKFKKNSRENSDCKFHMCLHLRAITRRSADADKPARRVCMSVNVTKHSTVLYVTYTFLLCNSNFVFKTRRF